MCTVYKDIKKDDKNSDSIIDDKTTEILVQSINANINESIEFENTIESESRKNERKERKERKDFLIHELAIQLKKINEWLEKEERIPFEKKQKSEVENSLCERFENKIKILIDSFNDVSEQIEPEYVLDFCENEILNEFENEFGMNSKIIREIEQFEREKEKLRQEENQKKAEIEKVDAIQREEEARKREQEARKRRS